MNKWLSREGRREDGTSQDEIFLCRKSWFRPWTVQGPILLQLTLKQLETLIGINLCSHSGVSECDVGGKIIMLVTFSMSWSGHKHRQIRTNHFASDIRKQRNVVSLKHCCQCYGVLLTGRVEILDQRYPRIY